MPRVFHAFGKFYDEASWKVVGWLFAFTIGVPCLTLLVFGLLVFVPRPFLALPREASNVSVEWTGIDEGEMTFRLPDSKTPEQWLEVIAASNGLVQDGALEYEKRQVPEVTTEVISLAYEPPTMEYRATIYGVRP